MDGLDGLVHITFVQQDGQRIDENSEHAKHSFLKVPVKIATIVPHRAEKRKIFFEK